MPEPQVINQTRAAQQAEMNRIRREHETGEAFTRRIALKLGSLMLEAEKKDQQIEDLRSELAAARAWISEIEKSTGQSG